MEPTDRRQRHMREQQVRENVREMTTFKLDTSGEVTLPPVVGVKAQRLAIVRWPDLSPFVQGYIEALIASIKGFRDPHWLKWDEDSGYRWTRYLAFRDLAPETLARITEDCERFHREHVLAGVLSSNVFWSMRQAGDFMAFPPLTLYLSDDGKVRFTA